MVDVNVEAKRIASYAWLVVVVAGVVVYCLWGYDAPSFKCQYYIMLCYVMLHSYLLTAANCVGATAPQPSFKYHTQICLVVVVVVVLRVKTVRCIAGSHLCSHLPLCTDI